MIKWLLPGSRSAVIFLCLVILAGVHMYDVKADSVITIPLPENARDSRQVTMSLRIPPHTEPYERDRSRPEVTSRSTLHYWNPNPMPKLERHDEAFEIFRNFQNKGWVKRNIVSSLIRRRDMTKAHAISTVRHIAENVIQIALAPNFHHIARTCNLTTSDIDDLRRMIKRFESGLILHGSNPEAFDRDLLAIQESFREARQGILKVLRVEGADDGSTVIHLSVD